MTIPWEIQSLVKDSELEHGHVFKEIAQPSGSPRLKNVPIRNAVGITNIEAGEIKCGRY